MPFSQSSQLAIIINFLESTQPQSILDVGTGMGQYGFLARTNLEHIRLFDVQGAHATQRPKSDWSIRIDGIEAFETYRTPVHDYAYNHIYWDDAQNILPDIPDQSYELVMAIDILEHLTTAEGEQFLQHLKRIAQKQVLISTPKTFVHQEVAANPYENHRSVWTEEQLKTLGFSQTLPNEESWVVVHTR